MNLMDSSADQLQFDNFDVRSYPQPNQSNTSSSGEPASPETGSKPSIWSFQFYQRFFDVNTDEVVERIKWSMLPVRSVNYLQSYIQKKPDLYGPFWICVTLVFSIAISGNLANYLQTAASRGYPWKYEFHAVTSAATLIFCYAWILPFIVWAALRWLGPQEQMQVQLLELICLYGYCLAVFIPVSVLWVIPVTWIQWGLTFIGSCTSGVVLVKSLYPAFNSTSYVVLILLLILHLLVAACFMLYFFHVPSSPKMGVHGQKLISSAADFKCAKQYFVQNSTISWGFFTTFST